MSENDLNKGVGKPLIVAGLGDVRDQLDRCFLRLGLELDPIFAGRKYVGEVNGRSTTITIAMRTRNKYVTGSISYRKFTGLWMDISVETPVMSRLMLGQPRGLARRVVRFMQRLCAAANRYRRRCRSLSKTSSPLPTIPPGARPFWRIRPFNPTSSCS